MGAGVAFALAAAASFGLALILTQHETQGLDGRWRTLFNMSTACVIALAVIGWRDGPHWPGSTAGWFGLAALSFLYGTAFTIMFTVLPKFGAASYSAIMNVEPIFALMLAWWLLGQSIAPSQVLGAVLVVGAVIWLGLRKTG
jgi:drug/metabolite transporter (DMT)-like permease